MTITKRESELILQKEKIFQELEDIRSKKQHLIQELNKNGLDLPFLKSEQRKGEERDDQIKENGEFSDK